jgi:hypothetical protein
LSKSPIPSQVGLPHLHHQHTRKASLSIFLIVLQKSEKAPTKVVRHQIENCLNSLALSMRSIHRFSQKKIKKNLQWWLRVLLTLHMEDLLYLQRRI